MGSEVMSVYEFTEEELSKPALPSLELLESRKPEETPDELLHRVASLFDVDVCDIRSGSVQPAHVLARHVLWAELRRRKWSTPAIGRFTGHDHTTVLNAVKGIIKCRPGLRSHLK